MQRYLEHVDVVLGQPGRQGDVRPEDHHVVQAEAPHPQMAQRAQHRDHRPPLPGLVVMRRGAEPHHRGHHHEQHRVQERDEAPAVEAQPEERHRRHGDDERRADELGDRRTDVAGPEDAEREALAIAREPRRVPRDPDAEGVAGEPGEECEDQQHREAVGLRDEERGHGRRQEHHDEDPSSAVTVGEDPGRQPPQRTVEDRRSREPGQLDVAEAELLADRDPEDAEHEPHGEHQREADGRQDEHAAPSGRLRRGRHRILPGVVG